MTNLDLDKMYEQASSDAHYAYTKDQREQALKTMELIELARRGQMLSKLQAQEAPAEKSVKTKGAWIEGEEVALEVGTREFTLEVTARRCPSNEVEGSAWLDPNDFAHFLRERFTVKMSDAYGLDAYNKHAGQLIVDVQVKNDTPGAGASEKPKAKKPKVRIVWPDDEHIEIFLDKKQVASANYDDHGSSGIFTLEAMAKTFAKAMGAKLVEERP